MAQDGKDEEKLELTPEGETLGYISLDQARVLSLQHSPEAPCDLPHGGTVRLRVVVQFVSFTVFLLLVVACTPSSMTDDDAYPPVSTLVPALQSTPAAIPDLEPNAIISFTLQTLEIEAKRKDLIAYIDSLSTKVGTYGKALAIERYFSGGVPSALRDAPPSGFEGMTTLRNRLISLHSPQSMRIIKESLLDVYNSEIQLASEQLAYPEITIDSLAYWRQLVSEGGPGEHYYEYMVGTDWFGLQENRQHVYALWGDVLKEGGIDPEGLTILDASETNIRHLKERFREAGFEAPFVTYFRVLGIESLNSIKGRYHLSFSENLRDLFRMQQRVGIFTESGIEPEPSWEAYVHLFGGRSEEKSEEGARILRAILEMTHEQREQAWLTFESGTPENLEELQEFIQTGMRGKLGNRGAEHFADLVPNWSLQWQLEQPLTATGSPMPFLEFLVERFNLNP